MNDQKKIKESYQYQYQYQYVTEDRSRIYDMQNQDNYEMAFDNVDYPSDFIDGWRTKVTKENENGCTMLESRISG